MNAYSSISFYLVNQSENWMTVYAKDAAGVNHVVNIDPAAFSAFLQNDGSGIGRQFGADIHMYIVKCPTNAYFKQMILNFLNRPAVVEVAEVEISDEEMVDVMAETSADLIEDEAYEMTIAMHAPCPKTLRYSAKDEFMMMCEAGRIGCKNYFEYQK